VHRREDDQYAAASLELQDGRRIDVGEALVSNASVWDTTALLQGGPMLHDFVEYGSALEMNDSMVHLHLGFSRRQGVLRICSTAPQRV
jgi:hypothetical protein